MAGLLDINPENPADLSLLSMDSVPVAPGLADQATAPGAGVPDMPSPSMDDQGPGFWTRLGKGFSDVVSGAGLALGGGLDPSIQGGERDTAGARALLSFSLNMLANSGPSYTPRGFGEILAHSLAAAGETNQLAELNSFRRSQAQATYGLKLEQQRWNSLMKGLILQKYADQIGRGKGADATIERLTGGAGTPPAGGIVSTTAPTPEVQADFVNKGWPLWADIGQKTGLPPEFVAGLSAHETNWGTSPAAQKGNLFGISDANGKPLAYDSADAGSNAFVTLMNSDRYKGVDRSGTPQEVATRLARAGYNPDTGGYGGRVGPAVDAVTRLRAGGSTATAAAPPAPPGAPPAPRVTVAGPGAGTPPAPPVTTAGSPPAAPPVASVQPTMTPPAQTGGVTTPTPPAPTPAPATTMPTPSQVIVPKPDYGDLEGAGRAALATRNEELKAAKSLPPDQKATAVAAALQKWQDSQAKLAEERRKLDQDYQVRLGQAQEAERIRLQQRAEKQADQEQANAQQIKLKELEGRQAQQLEDQKSGNARVSKRLDESFTAADAARSSLESVDKLQLQMPAIMAAGPDPLAERYPDFRNIARALGAGTEADWAKWNAQDAFQAVSKELGTRLQQSMKGSVSDYEARNLAAMLPTLAQDPANMPYVLGLMRAGFQRSSLMHKYREDFAAMPENKGKTAGMDEYAWAQISPGWNKPYPPPLFATPPALESAKLKPGASPAEIDQARQVDNAQQNAYANDAARKDGVPFQIWAPDGRSRLWMVIEPDGQVYQQPVPRRR